MQIGYKSAIREAIHETATDLYHGGAIDRVRLREYDAACLKLPAAMVPDRIRALRDREGVSQLAFAHALGVSKNLVSDWERGVKKPGGPARRLLQVVEVHWLALLDTLPTPKGQSVPDAAE